MNPNPPRIRAALVVLLLAAAPATTRAQLLVPQCPTVNYTGAPDQGVFAIAKSGNIVYVGGNFDYLGPITGSAGLVDASTGTPTAGVPVVDGSVSSCAPDGSGGWFIGGQFTKVGGKSRSNLAHINPDLSVDDAWTPSVSGLPAAIVVGGGRVFVGASGVRAYDATTGAQSFSTGNGTVSALALSGSTLYVGGSFSSMGGQPHTSLAAIDASTGSALPSWTCDATGLAVKALALDGSTLYVGGQFTQLGGFSRNNLGAVDAATGATVVLWNPNMNGAVFALSVSGGTLYAGGQFSQIGASTTRLRLAGLTTTSPATATVWDPQADQQVNALSISGGTVYVGGLFKTMGGLPRLQVAAISTAGTGTVGPWRPETNNQVSVIQAVGSQVFVGGPFASIGGKARTNLGAFDATTGAILPWDPGANAQVRSLATSGSIVYAGGSFTTIGGQARNFLAALDGSTGVPTTWNPNPNSLPYAIVPSGTLVYVGGSFTTIGSTPTARANIAALNAAGTGTVTSWNPNANATVTRLLLSGGLVYVGGTFTNVGGQPRIGLAALNPSTGLANGWDPSASNIYGMATDGTTLWVIGEFTSAGVGAPLRNRIAGIDMTTGFATSFDAHLSGPGSSLLIRSDIQFAHSNVWVLASLVSSPVTFSGQSRYLGQLDPVTGSPTSFNPPYLTAVSNYLSPLLYDGTVLYVTGASRLTTLAGPIRESLVAFDLSIPLDVGDPIAASDLSLSIGPNPTSGFTHVRLTLPRESRASVGVFDLQGREVARLADSRLAAGSRDFVWNAGSRSGVYFVSAEAAGEKVIRRVVVLR